VGRKSKAKKERRVNPDPQEQHQYRERRDARGPNGSAAAAPEHESTTVSLSVPEGEHDLGPAVLDYVYALLQIEERWTVREDRGFSWWPHRHAQRVWAEPPRVSRGERVTLLRAETRFVRNVPDTAWTEKFIAETNAFANLSALVYDRDRACVSAHCAVYMHPQNLWMKRIFGSAALLQASAAESNAVRLADALEAEPDVSPHPDAGKRPEEDEILDAGELFIARGQESSPFSDSDLKTFRKEIHELWEGASIDCGTLSGRVPTENGMPSPRIEVSISQDHPVLGTGALLLLHLPKLHDPGRAAALANDLNRSEAEAGIEASFLGAWCAREEGVSFAVFLPALLADSDPAKGRRAFLFYFALALMRRAQWADEYLAPAFFEG
jgi:hypothetical protein